MYVIKRDGHKEPVQFDKITARIANLTNGLNKDYIDPVSAAAASKGFADLVTLPARSPTFCKAYKVSNSRRDPTRRSAGRGGNESGSGHLLGRYYARAGPAGRRDLCVATEAGEGGRAALRSSVGHDARLPRNNGHARSARTAACALAGRSCSVLTPWCCPCFHHRRACLTG
jgi:hypothetical protein